MRNKLKKRLTAPTNNVHRRRVDKRKLSPLAATVSDKLEQLTQVAKERVSEQVAIPFRERGVFKGFVLAVLSKNSSAAYQGNIEKDVFMDQAPPPIIFRIPEMHACIPAPDTLDSSEGFDSLLVEAHPVALPMNDSVRIPKVGALVDIIYEDPVNMIGPRYLGPVKGQSAEKTNLNSTQEEKALTTFNDRFSNVNVSDYDSKVSIGATIEAVEED
tara:strand:+ start:937 stop:1581 length:645 start_codon:yes stop_codon:yes gene_type:complete